MSDRDRGDSPDAPDASLSLSGEAGSAEADAPAPRARKSTSRARRRSLRVPVDEVPRRGPSSDSDGSSETPLELDDDVAALASEPTVVRPEPQGLLLPPPSGETGLSATDASGEELALELSDDDASIPELDAPPDLETSPELEAASREMESLLQDGVPELEAEPTRVAPRSAPPPRSLPTPQSGAPRSAPPGMLGVMGPAGLAPVAMDGSLTTPRRPSSVPPPSALGFSVPKIPASPPPSDPPAAASDRAPASDGASADSTLPDAAPRPVERASESTPADAPVAGEPAEPIEPVKAHASEPRPSRPERLSSPPANAVAVVVARMVRVSAPPPALAAAPVAVAAPAVSEPDLEEPEISFGDEPLDELHIDLGDDDERAPESRVTDPAIRASAEIADDADVEVADLADSELDEPAAPMPPPPPREPARSQPKLEPARDERALAEEEELAADDLAADDLELAELAKARSAPPPPPAAGEKQAPPPIKAAPPIPAAAPKAAEKPTEPSPSSAPSPDAVAEARRAKKKANWWEDFFNDDYLRTVPAPNPRQIARQCDFIEGRLKLKTGSTILDVGCGLGLHAIELTRRGYLVVGLDLSLPMLSRAADEAQDEGFRINFLHADMREMNFEGAFDAVLCIGTTFGYFDDDQNRALVERLYRALKPKGVLLLDVVNRDFVFKSQPNLVWFEGDGCVVMEETSANYITSRLHVKRTVILDDGRQRDNNYSVRLYALHELGQILHHRGFRVGEVSGREATPGVFFGADSPRLIIVAERRPQQAAPPTPPGNKKPEDVGSSAEASDATTTPGSTAAPAPSSTAAPATTPDEGEPGGSGSSS